MGTAHPEMTIKFDFSDRHIDLVERFGENPYWDQFL
jgi:hypothetical protein